MRLGSMLWHCQKDRLALYLMFSISARSVPSPLGQIAENFTIGYFHGEIASGAQCFAFGKRAHGALPFGVNFSSLGSRPLGQISEKFSISLFRGGGCVWAQCFGIVRKNA